MNNRFSNTAVLLGLSSAAALAILSAGCQANKAPATGAACCNTMMKDNHHDSDKMDEQTIAVDAVPPAVVAGVKKAMPDAQIVGAEKESKMGVVVYELDLKCPGDKMCEVKVAEDGKILKTKMEGDKKEEHDGKDEKDEKDDMK